MPIFETVGLMLFVVLIAVLLVRYVHATVDREFQNLARAETDGAYRRGELARADQLLASVPPQPEGAKPPAGPPSTALRTLAPILLGLGVALLWGGVFSREERALWLWGGGVALGLAIAIMLATLGRRKWERSARLLRYRADLRRLDGDRNGSAADLRELLRLTPWDDAAWAELADDLAASGKPAEALEAVRRAARLDPAYDDYRMLETSLAIRTGQLDLARDAISGWAGLARTAQDDPRVAIYRAALELAEGRREEATRNVREVVRREGDVALDVLDSDVVLDGVRGLLPKDEAGGDA